MRLSEDLLRLAEACGRFRVRLVEAYEAQDWAGVWAVMGQLEWLEREIKSLSSSADIGQTGRPAGEPPRLA